MRLPRRLSLRLLFIPVVMTATVLVVFYINFADYLPDLKKCQPVVVSTKQDRQAVDESGTSNWHRSSLLAYRRSFSEPTAKFPSSGCPSIRPSAAVIDTVDIYPQLNFQVKTATHIQMNSRQFLIKMHIAQVLRKARKSA